MADRPGSLEQYLLSAAPDAAFQPESPVSPLQSGRVALEQLALSRLLDIQQQQGSIPGGYVAPIPAWEGGGLRLLDQSNPQALALNANRMLAEAELGRLGEEGEQLQELADKTVLDSLDYIMQAPLTDALVVMSRAYLDAPGSEEEARAAAMQAGRDYLGEEGWNYLLPWLERPEMRSFMAEVPEIGPAAAMTADLLSGLVGAADWAFDAGRVVNAARRLRPESVMGLSSELRQMAARPLTPAPGVVDTPPRFESPDMVVVRQEKAASLADELAQGMNPNELGATWLQYVPEFRDRVIQDLRAGAFEGMDRAEARMRLQEIVDEVYPLNSQGLRKADGHPYGFLDKDDAASLSEDMDDLLQHMGLPSAKDMNQALVIAEDGIFTPGLPAVADVVQLPNGMEVRELRPVYTFTNNNPNSGYQRYRLAPDIVGQGGGGEARHGSAAWFAEDPSLAAWASVNRASLVDSERIAQVAARGASEDELRFGTRAFRNTQDAVVRPSYLTIERPFDIEAVPPDEVLAALARRADEMIAAGTLDLPLIVDTPAMQALYAQGNVPNMREIARIQQTGVRTLNEIADKFDAFANEIDNMLTATGGQGVAMTPQMDALRSDLVDALMDNNFMDLSEDMYGGLQGQLDWPDILAEARALSELFRNPDLALNSLPTVDAIRNTLQQHIALGTNSPHASWFHQRDGAYGWIRDSLFGRNPDALNQFLQQWGYDALTAISTETKSGVPRMPGYSDRIYAVLDPDRILNFDDIEGALARGVESGAIQRGSPEWQQWEQILQDRQARGVTSTTFEDWVAAMREGADLADGPATPVAMTLRGPKLPLPASPPSRFVVPDDFDGYRFSDTEKESLRQMAPLLGIDPSDVNADQRVAIALVGSTNSLNTYDEVRAANEVTDLFRLAAPYVADRSALGSALSRLFVPYDYANPSELLGRLDPRGEVWEMIARWDPVTPEDSFNRLANRIRSNPGKSVDDIVDELIDEGLTPTEVDSILNVAQIAANAVENRGAVAAAIQQSIARNVRNVSGMP